eukprot:gb/GECG01009245.1/.p1 GENE.gb/GECG01009245.1/~~gb/GECG01009245.1/.p1  ORF type:complete len:637 (+),score=57.05 gb/GECG01009245.1/:1-1911(+)
MDLGRYCNFLTRNGQNHDAIQQVYEAKLQEAALGCYKKASEHHPPTIRKVPPVYVRFEPNVVERSYQEWLITANAQNNFLWGLILTVIIGSYYWVTDWIAYANNAELGAERVFLRGTTMLIIALGIYPLTFPIRRCSSRAQFSLRLAILCVACVLLFLRIYLEEQEDIYIRSSAIWSVFFKTAVLITGDMPSRFYALLNVFDFAVHLTFHYMVRPLSPHEVIQWELLILLVLQTQFYLGDLRGREEFRRRIISWMNGQVSRGLATVHDFVSSYTREIVTIQELNDEGKPYFQFVSASAYSLTGWRPRELCSSKLADFVDTKDVHYVECALKKCKQQMEESQRTSYENSGWRDKQLPALSSVQEIFDSAQSKNATEVVSEILPCCTAELQPPISTRVPRVDVCVGSEERAMEESKAAAPRPLEAWHSQSTNESPNTSTVEQGRSTGLQTNAVFLGTTVNPLQLGQHSLDLPGQLSTLRRYNAFSGQSFESDEEEFQVEEGMGSRQRQERNPGNGRDHPESEGHDLSHGVPAHVPGAALFEETSPRSTDKSCEGKAENGKPIMKDSNISKEADEGGNISPIASEVSACESFYFRMRCKTGSLISMQGSVKPTNEDLVVIRKYSRSGTSGARIHRAGYT